MKKQTNAPKKDPLHGTVAEPDDITSPARQRALLHHNYCPGAAQETWERTKMLTLQQGFIYKYIYTGSFRSTWFRNRSKQVDTEIASNMQQKQANACVARAPQSLSTVWEDSEGRWLKKERIQENVTATILVAMAIHLCSPASGAIITKEANGRKAFLRVFFHGITQQGKVVSPWWQSGQTTEKSPRPQLSIRASQPFHGGWLCFYFSSVRH